MALDFSSKSLHFTTFPLLALTVACKVLNLALLRYLKHKVRELRAILLYVLAVYFLYYPFLLGAIRKVP